MCAACATPHECDPHESLPDRGWTLHYGTFGYYGGFSDDQDDLYGHGELKYWWLCHGCITTLLETFPRLGDSLGPGHHPCESDTPCCRHAWRGTELFGAYRDGRPVPGVHTQTAWPDGVWHDDDPIP